MTITELINALDEIRARMEACPRYCDMREHHERTCAVHYKSDVRTLLAENERLARENAELRGAMRAHDVGDSHLAVDWLEARVAELEAQNAALAAALLAELDGANTDRVAALNRATSAEIRCGELEATLADECNTSLKAKIHDQTYELARLNKKIAELEAERDSTYATLEAVAVKGLGLSPVGPEKMPDDWAKYDTMSEHVAQLRQQRDALAAALEAIRMHVRDQYIHFPGLGTLTIGEYIDKQGGRELLAARLAAERKAGKVEAEKVLTDLVESISIEFDDERLRYITVQIGRKDYERALQIVAKIGRGEEEINTNLPVCPGCSEVNGFIAAYLLLRYWK